MGDGTNLERRRMPLKCDGCGRDANAAGMLDEGWAVSPVTAAVPGTYCLRCASALRMLQWFVRCVECGATVESESVAEAQSWRFHPDELGQLQALCPLCSLHARLDPASADAR